MGSSSDRPPQEPPRPIATDGGLEPLAPAEALDLYLEDRRDEIGEATLYSHRSRLGKFVEWCDVEGVENLNDLAGRDLLRFKQWRKADGDLEPVSLQGQLSTLRVFLRFCERIDAVEEGLAGQVALPDLAPDEQVSSDRVTSEQGTAIREYLARFRYASREHVVFAVAWEAGLRLGSLRALDVGDFDSDRRCLDLVHRPEEETPLKNGADGERPVNLSTATSEAVQDYVDHRRPDVTDDSGREPLFATEQGRMAASTYRRLFYRVTRPCVYGDECPHGREMEECEATTASAASKCPSSRGPHAARRGSITEHRSRGVNVEVVSERVNATPEVIEKHYDERSVEEKREQRREALGEEFEGF